jgi:hypothetical protein
MRYARMEVQPPPFLTSTLDVGEWSASQPGRLTPEKGVLGSYWMGGSVGPRVGVDPMEKKKFLLLRGTEPRSSNHSQ